MSDLSKGMGIDPEDIIRQVGGTWAKEPCETCGGRTYYMSATGRNLRFCLGCQEDESECSCESDE